MLGNVSMELSQTYKAIVHLVHYNVNYYSDTLLLTYAILKQVMQFLLKRGADAMLCNHSNQTALHVALQEELLTAMIRRTPSEAALTSSLEGRPLLSTGPDGERLRLQLPLAI